MSSREEIREGIDRSIEFVLMAAYHAGKTGESISETIDKCKPHLKEDLHSQGVVIKVGGEWCIQHGYPIPCAKCGTKHGQAPIESLIEEEGNE